MHKSIGLWFGIAISGACFGLIFWQIDFKRVMVTVGVVNWRSLSAITGAYMAFMFIRAWRWQIMLENKASYWSVFHAQSIGYLLTNILPFRMGDLGRVYIIGQKPGLNGLQALSTVALERVLDMIIIVLFFTLSLTMIPKIPPIMVQAGHLFTWLSIISICIMFLSVKLRRQTLSIIQLTLGRIKCLKAELWLNRAELILKGFKSIIQWRQSIGVLGLSLLIWFSAAAAYYWGIGVFWPDVTWQAAFLTLCAGAFGVSIPSSPSAIGVFHASVWLALSVFPVSLEQALGFALVYHALTFVIVLILGAIGLWRNEQTLRELSKAAKNAFSHGGRIVPLEEK